MQELLILDNTERLLAAGPYFNAVPKWTLMHLEDSSGSKYDHSIVYSSWPRIYNEVLDMFLFRGVNNYLYRMVPENFFIGSNTVVQESTLLIHQLVIEPSSGRTWGVVNNSSGADGLYLRTAAVAGSWSKIIGAANGANLKVWKKTNGDIWYNDATAGNWYQLQNGAAGNVQATPPTNLNTDWSAGYEGMWNIDFFSGKLSTQTPLCWDGDPGYNLIASGSTYNAETWDSGAAVYANDAAQSAATLKALVPTEFVSAARFSNQTTTKGCSSKTFRLDETYSLIAFVSNLTDVVSINATANYERLLSFENGKTKVALALLNKATWTCKFLGTFSVPYFCEGLAQPANEPAAGTYLLLARMKSGAIELGFSGRFARYNATNRSGLLWCSIPLNKLDF